jgi:protein-S-isoprenylcysteine O-methyltransferase Ste14
MSRFAVFFLLVVAPALSIFLALLGLETLRQNLLGWFLLIMGIAYPAGGVIFYFIRREPFIKMLRGAESVVEEKTDLSFWAILPGFLAVFFAPPLEWFYLPPVLPRSLLIQIAGLVFILASLVLRVWARAHIRGLYTGHVQIQKDHQLVQSGPYHLVRHPGYSGFLLMALGVVVGYSSWIGLAAIPLLFLPGLAYRMKVEERLLLEQFGEEYRAYAKRSKKLIPGIW